VIKINHEGFKEKSVKTSTKTALHLIIVLAGILLSECSGHNNENIPIPAPEGYFLLWHDEFERNGKPDSTYWSYEYGFVRNEELQWYQERNAYIQDGNLIIEGRREEVRNNRYDSLSTNWKEKRPHAEYTSASINTRSKVEFQHGIIEVRAKIDTALGMWPAIWTLGKAKPWPANGEIDIMEYYRRDGIPYLLANAAWRSKQKGVTWDSELVPFETFSERDPSWAEKFHIWKMDWTKNHLRLYLDGQVLNEIDLTQIQNFDGFNPFHQPHYLLLNLAIGSNGGDPSKTKFPRKYQIDYVRVFQKKQN
jgi:beta-glucanase (GH16 family)